VYCAIRYKLYERYNFLQIRLERYYLHIDELHPKAKFVPIKKVAEDEHRTDSPN